ncbi:MAG: rod shape-determining protein MreD [Clostridiales bacterium]|jgi:rod shape-determining protein MreD|nr:rod shape-determining protein MreD [Clostridiales bacterium]
MKLRYVVLLALINFILSSTLFQIFRINDTLPNLVIVFSVVLLALTSERDAYVFAAISGALQDVFLGRMLSINLILYIAVVYLASRLIVVLFKGNYITPVFLIAGCTLFYHATFYLIVFFFQATVPLSLIYHKILTEIIYNSVLGMLIYSRIFKWVYGYKLGDYNA